MAVNHEYRIVIVHNHVGDVWGKCRFIGPGKEPTSSDGYTSVESARSDGYSHLEFRFGYGDTSHYFEVEGRLVHDWDGEDWS